MTLLGLLGTPTHPIHTHTPHYTHTYLLTHTHTHTISIAHYVSYSYILPTQLTELILTHLLTHPHSHHPFSYSVTYQIQAPETSQHIISSHLFQSPSDAPSDTLSDTHPHSQHLLTPSLSTHPFSNSVTYQIQAPETNYATVATSLTSPSTVSSLSVAINKAGYRDALVDSAPILVDLSPTSAPTVANTLKVVMLTATQDVADVTVSQAASSEFQTAFLTGVIEVLQEADANLPTSGVKITTINADPSGN